MMTLARLNKLCTDYKIDPSDIGFSGQHDVVYIESNQLNTLIPPDEFAESWPEAKKEQFSNDYGIYIVEDYWGFYT